MSKEQPTLRNISKEIRTRGYFARARQRAQRRKSPWNLILIPLDLIGIGGFTYILFQIMWRVNTAIYPDHAGRLGEFWGKGIGFNAFVSSFLLLMPLFFAAIPLGLLFANSIAWIIPPARRVFDGEAEGVKWASFPEAMGGVWNVAMVLVPICLLLSLIGALTLKSLK